MIINDLLNEGLTNKVVELAGHDKKLTINGITKTYPVYKIRLDVLYYNDKNDRIATWISKYKAENNTQSFNTFERENYNDKIQEFIEDSNKSAIDKTKSNIKIVGQREPGVVLNDGRVVDGNRRFTCLRLLNAENTQQFLWFEAVILDYDLVNNEKQIKMLELAIQHGEDTKIDYNPIDRLVGVYNDIVETNLLSIQEYADATQETTVEINKKIELAKLMIEYLEFLGFPKQFYIARENDIEGPLHEIRRGLKKCKTEEQKDQYKQIFFNALLHRPEGDMTRYIRKMADLINTQQESSFVEEQMKCVLETVEEICSDENEGKDALEVISQIRENEELTNKVNRSKEKAVEKVKREQNKNKPIEQIKKSIDILDDIDDYNVFQTLTVNQIEDILEQLSILEEKISEIRENIGE